MVVKTEEDFLSLQEELSAIINEICKTKRSDNNALLEFIGGLTMIERCMKWENGKAMYTDINDNGVLIS